MARRRRVVVVLDDSTRVSRDDLNLILEARAPGKKKWRDLSYHQTYRSLAFRLAQLEIQGLAVDDIHDLCGQVDDCLRAWAGTVARLIKEAA